VTATPFKDPCSPLPPKVKVLELPLPGVTDVKVLKYWVLTSCCVPFEISSVWYLADLVTPQFNVLALPRRLICSCGAVLLIIDSAHTQEKEEN